MNSKELAKTIRLESLKMHHSSRTSHIGSCFSVADILAVLYTDVLEYDPHTIPYDERDRVIYSKGHAASIYYAVLAEKGYFNKSCLAGYGQPDQPLACHVTAKVSGVEFSTGSLGHGLSMGCGIALALKRKQKPCTVYVIISDGELNEGSTWEGIMFAGHHKLDNLVVIHDSNKLQAYGRTSEILDMGDLCQKLECFGFISNRVDGHNHDDLRNIFDDLRSNSNCNAPHFIVANTIKGKGVSFMENNLAWHYKCTNETEYLLAKHELENNK